MSHIDYRCLECHLPLVPGQACLAHSSFTKCTQSSCLVLPLWPSWAELILETHLGAQCCALASGSSVAPVWTCWTSVLPCPHWRVSGVWKLGYLSICWLCWKAYYLFVSVSLRGNLEVCPSVILVLLSDLWVQIILFCAATCMSSHVTHVIAIFDCPFVF